MERISGVICEFNPLHEGHRYLLAEASKTGRVVCIMSGNFVQRGEVAVRDKYSRAKDAIEAGADLVVELPFPWCASPAEFFARAGVVIASKLGVTDLYFGSESGDLASIIEAAGLCGSKEFTDEVASLYQGNTGYAEARYLAALKLSPLAAPVFNSSNDSLAAEYVRQSRNVGAKLDFHAVRRIACPSASEIRARSGFTHRLFDIEREAFCLGLASKTSFDAACGILNRLEKCAIESASGEEMLSLAKTKKYTDARLRRAALFAVTGTSAEDISSIPDYTVLLGATSRGRETLKKAEGIEIVTKPADAKSEKFRAASLADRLFALSSNPPSKVDEFLKKSPFIG